MKTVWLLLLVTIAVCCVDDIKAQAPDGHYETEVDVTATWKPSFVYENRGNADMQQKITLTKGLKNLQSETKTLTATHNIGVTLSAGDPFQIVNATVGYSYANQKSTVSMKQNEIYSSSVFEFTVVIPPKSKFIRWELDTEVAGAVIQYMYLIDETHPISATPTIPQVKTSRARIIVRQQINVRTSIIRIKHQEKQQYITVVSRKDWPAATLGHSNLFHFVLCQDDRGIRIKTLNTMYPGYEWAYSSRQGGVYFDKDHVVGYSSDVDVNIQHWKLSKAMPLHHGDIVTFRNKFHDSSGLCHFEGPETNVYCLAQREDKWVLEVVKQLPEGQNKCVKEVKPDWE